uniref:Uncharacterized protein n=1 Tax=Arundo donax TaxID=35708 RepID=A0A0A9A6G2_ARUDO
MVGKLEPHYRTGVLLFILV